MLPVLLLCLVGATLAQYPGMGPPPMGPPRGTRYQECPRDVQQMQQQQQQTFQMGPQGDQKDRGCRDLLKGLSTILGYDDGMGPPMGPPPMGGGGPMGNFGVSPQPYQPYQPQPYGSASTPQPYQPYQPYPTPSFNIQFPGGQINGQPPTPPSFGQMPNFNFNNFFTTRSIGKRQAYPYPGGFGGGQDMEAAKRANDTIVCNNAMMKSILSLVPQDICCNLLCYCGELTGGKSCTKIASQVITVTPAVPLNSNMNYNNYGFGGKK